VYVSVARVARLTLYRIFVVPPSLR